MSDAPVEETEPEARPSIRLLLVGEDETSARRVCDVLDRPDGTRFVITHVPQVDDALLKLQDENFDVVLIDLSIHEGYGLDSLLRARVAARSVPIVVLTYHRDEALGLKAARAGAQDYLTKGEVTPELMSRTLVHAVERHRILDELTNAQQRQHFLATHDALTSLPNRYAFLEQLSHAMAQADRDGSNLAVIFFDLDGFKAVNDNRGHAVGDELLQDVAKRLRREIRKSDLVARLGGDEFVAALRNVPDEETVVRVAEHFREALEKPYHIDGEESWISTSIGVSFHPADGKDPDTLVRCADTAMYRAKSTGKNQVCVWQSEMNEEAARRFEMINGLREAMHSGQLLLMYQPQIHVATETLVGAEALLRWNHPTRGLISPGEFIGVAEESGIIDTLGEWVLRTACLAARSWVESADLRLAVNVSQRQLDQRDFPERVERVLRETGMPASRLELEITESLAASEQAVAALGRIRELGIRTAVDDFGTGYSSLTLLKRMPVDLLKIDQSLVQGATESEADAVILEAVIHMAHGMGLDLLAEGVETLEQMDSLRRRGCELMQGYLFAKPMPKSEFEALMTAPDASWRLPILRPESWAPPDFSLEAPEPECEPEPVVADEERDYPALVR
jgi:diguanylate cyclase (GGDEF)-like protein